MNALTADSGLVCVITASGRLCDSQTVALIYAVLFHRFQIHHTAKSSDCKLKLTEVDFSSRVCYLSSLDVWRPLHLPTSNRPSLNFVLLPFHTKIGAICHFCHFDCISALGGNNANPKLHFCKGPDCVCACLSVRSHGNLFKGSTANCLLPNHTQ